MKPVPKKRKDAYRSAADIKEQEAFEKRNYQIKLLLIVGIPAAIAFLYLFYKFSSPAVYVD